MTRIDEIKERLSKAMPESKEYQLAGYLSTFDEFRTRHPEEMLPLANHVLEGIKRIPIYHDDIAYLLRIAEAAEVMREALNQITLTPCTRTLAHGEEALAKAKELME